MTPPRGTVSGNAGLPGRTRRRALPNDKGALLCMTPPRGTVSGNAGLPGRTRQRALPAEGPPFERGGGLSEAPRVFALQKAHKADAYCE